MRSSHASLPALHSVLLLPLIGIAATTSADEALQLAFAPERGQLPVWSPDGTQIAFESWRGRNGDIRVMPATGGEATQITDHPANDFFPSAQGQCGAAS